MDPIDVSEAPPAPTRAMPEARRREVVEFLASLMGSGIDDPGALAAAARKRFAVTRQTALKYVQVVLRTWNRTAQRSLAEHRARAIATRMTAMRRAMAAQRVTVLKDGTRVAVPQPDLDAFIRADDSLAKVLGVFAPERASVVVHHLTTMLDDVVAVIRAEVADLDLRVRLLNGIRRTMEAGADAALRARQPLLALPPGAAAPGDAAGDAPPGSAS